jgi:hypothetical protein
MTVTYTRYDVRRELLTEASRLLRIASKLRRIGLIEASESTINATEDLLSIAREIAEPNP